MIKGTNFILDPVSVRKFIDDYDNPDAVPDRLVSGAFIAEVKLDAPAPDDTDRELVVTGLNGWVCEFDATTDGEYEFIWRLRDHVLMLGRDKADAETVVLFRKSVGEHEDVTAVFPFEEAIRDKPYMGCYAHVGQHGSCHIDWVVESTRAATPEEYAPLKRELEQAPFGYKFLILEDLTSLELEEPEFEAPAP
jgi:hypothetical protein